MLPEMTAIGQPAMLVAPRGVFSEQEKIALTSPEGESVVTLTRMVEARGGFSQFEFQEVEQPKAAPVVMPVEDHAFEGLWERL